MGEDWEKPDLVREDQVKRSGEQELIDGLTRGDEASFLLLVEQYHRSMLRIAMLYVHDHILAEEIVQETWISVLQNIKGFQGRSSLKTWIFNILINIARRSWKRENRSIPFSLLQDAELADAEMSVDADRFFPADHPYKPGLWAIPPRAWDLPPEEYVLNHEIQVCIQKSIDELPQYQRFVITLRDIEGWTSEQVCSVLELSEANQRVLLHRARSKVRRALEKYFEGGTTDAI